MFNAKFIWSVPVKAWLTRKFILYFPYSKYNVIISVYVYDSNLFTFILSRLNLTPTFLSTSESLISVYFLINS